MYLYLKLNINILTLGLKRLACITCQDMLGLLECRHIAMIPTEQRQEIMSWPDTEPALKHYYNPPIGPNFTSKEVKLKFYELSEELPYEGLKSIQAIDLKLTAVVNRMYMNPSVLHKCDLSDLNNLKRLKWGLRMRGAVTETEIENAFRQVEPSKSKIIDEFI